MTNGGDNHENSITVIDLYCGAGGATTGINLVDDTNIVAGVDIDEDALAFSREQYDHPIIEHDLSHVDTTVLPTETVDWVHASPPCPGFSNAGPHTDYDERNALLLDTLDWVDELEPSVVTIENVPNLVNETTRDGRSYIDLVHERLAGMGYESAHSVVNAADYGVPQERERLLIVASRAGEPEQVIPDPTHSVSGPIETLSGRELLSWNTVGDVFDNGHECSMRTEHRESTRERIGKTDQGKSVYSKGHNIRLSPDEPAPTVRASPNWHHCHPDESRSLCAHELATLQSFPRGFVEEIGKVSTARKLVGNAVPPLLMRRVAMSVQRSL